MSSIVCLRHPEYKGNRAPILSCKNCCTIYITFIKNANEEKRQSFNAYKWIAEKRAKEDAKRKLASDVEFSPELI